MGIRRESKIADLNGCICDVFIQCDDTIIERGQTRRVCGEREAARRRFYFLRPCLAVLDRKQLLPETRRQNSAQIHRDLVSPQQPFVENDLPINEDRQPRIQEIRNAPRITGAHVFLAQKFQLLPKLLAAA